ncbi:gluconate 2-dehydrogenase subunit 3 family protein [Salicibibacter halophilus]|uniref:gluconate 2-dehydrogenase subunit 3 family protein n=1 Tax=Salicibibacter halophilus TaxID=2502791 RepID=UPI001D05B493|nr:gluconate 2-dehydrogenase subunit 3 family protein [Salicibibacter halophilus]
MNIIHLRPAYQRASPIEGKPFKCFSLAEWEQGAPKVSSVAPRRPYFPVPTLRAAVETIFPGATEVKADRYVLHALRTFDHEDVFVYEEGLAEMNRLSHKYFRTFFEHLGQQQRNTIVKQIEETEFFAILRQHTMEGMFADPIYGGNDGQKGWKLIGFPGARLHPITHLSRGWKPYE